MPAKKFGSQIDLQKIPVLGLVAESAATGSAPASPSNGQLWYDTTVNRLYVRENGAWVLASQTGAELQANKGIANGYASLDSGTKVPLAQLPVASSGTSSATQVVRADDSRLSDNRTPTDGSVTGGPAGAGVKIAANTITHDNVAAANKDGAAGTASMRTLGTGAQQALAGNTRLDQITAPTAAVSLNSQKITNLATPTAATDAATKGYVDNLSAGLDPKGSVRAASTGNVTVTYTATGGTSGRGQITAAPNTLDGVALAANDRILLKDQSTGAQNGIWVVTTVGTGANGVWDRAADFDQDAEVTAGAYTFVEEGTQADTGWVLTTNNPITIGGASGTSLAFTQFSGAGQITAGAGLTKTGNTLDVGGTTNRITVTADNVDIAATYVGQTSITTLGTVATGTWSADTIALNKGGTGATTATAARTNLGAVGKYAATLGALTAGVETIITHNLNTTDVIAKFYDAATGYEIEFSWRFNPGNANEIGVTADIAYSASAVRVVVMG